MIIATNTPFSFAFKEGYDFIRLGETSSVPSMIVLMLPKNFGTASVDDLKALTQLVSAYASSVPCYIIGCESTIPNENLTRYLNKEREDAVRELCNEVLKRSKSIGVRGEITSRYLVEIIGLDADRVDNIYDKARPDNARYIRKFLEKNDCELKSFVFNILRFQRSPQKVTAGRGPGFRDEIVLNKPYITAVARRVRLNCDVEIDGQTKTLWCETSEKYEDYLLKERADAFLSVIVPYAMRTGRNIICRAPVTEQFLHNLTEVLIPQLSTYDPRLHRSTIIATGDSSRITNGDGRATGMSCGVDSFYAASLYTSSKFSSMNLTHLYVGNYLYGNGGEIYTRAALVADEMELPLVETTTNINSELALPHLPTHFFKTMFGVLALRKLFQTYYYATTQDFSHFELHGNGSKDTAYIELLLLYVFSCADFQVITGGVKSERAEKTKALASFGPALRHLNVCMNPHATSNCGTCGKCRRTLVTLDCFGLLDKFKDVFPVDEYRSNRFENFVYLMSHKKSTYLADVYAHFKATEPHLIKQAEEEFDRRRGSQRGR